MASKTLTAHEWPLRKIFSSDYEFRIPDYQRPYRWGVEQAVQLLDDLLESLYRDPLDPYFLGSLVLVEQDDGHYDVIDGQQRLTTLTVLFSVLRDLSSGKFADELGDLVLEPGSELAEIPARPRLSLREQEKDFFAKFVLQPGSIPTLIGLSDNTASTEPQRAIRDNAAALQAALGELDESSRKALATLVSTRTYLVVVSTPDLNSAYRIFSVMNARGLDLSPTDIFKSRIIGALPPGSDYAKRWEDAEETLGTEGFTDLFRDIRTVISGDRARRELLREFPEQVLNAYLDEGKAADFVDELLLPYALAFERTIERDLGPDQVWDSVNQELRRLSMIDNKDWRPIALWALTAHPDDPHQLSAILKKLERLAASMLIRAEYTTPRISRYLELLSQLKDGEGLDAKAFELSDEERRLTREGLGGEVYRMQTRRARFVLLRLDELLSKEPGATYKHNIISIEHVLPQTPAEGSQWLTDFTDEEQRQYWTHRLGNLLLLNRRKNSQARNFDFATKKSKYFTVGSGSAVFALTTQVLQHDTWTPQVVEQRQSELVSVLIKEWELA